MSTTHERLLATAERLGFQAGGLLDAKRHRQSEILALNAVGILMFLVVDEGTPDEMRTKADAMARIQRNVAAQARSEWLKSRQSGRLQGKMPGVPDPELDEALEDAEYVMRSVAEEMK